MKVLKTFQTSYLSESEEFGTPQAGSKTDTLPINKEKINDQYDSYLNVRGHESDRYNKIIAANTDIYNT